MGKQYAHSATIVLDYTVADPAGSGVKDIAARMDAASTVGGHGLLTGQRIDLLREITLGRHTFTINAVDNVGNPAASSVTFEIVVTPNAIKDEVTRFASDGFIKNRGLANSLLAKLTAAAAAIARENCMAAANIYRAFINELQAQSGRGVDATASAIMIEDAQFLIAHCAGK